MTKCVEAITVAACVVCSAAGLAAERGGPIRQHVHEHGSLERIIVSTDKQIHLADLVGMADLVIEGSPVAQRSYLDAAEARIFTDYTFRIDSLVKYRRQPALRVGRQIVVRRESGTVTIDGATATMIENDFPAFDARARYVLFLKELPGDNHYVVLAGGRGAFVSGEQIEPVAAISSAVEGIPGRSHEAFFSEVRALLKFTE
jgi:hypothetical protein